MVRRAISMFVALTPIPKMLARGIIVCAVPIFGALAMILLGYDSPGPIHVDLGSYTERKQVSSLSYQPSPLITFTTVFAKILQSNHKDQLSIYSQSSRTISSKSLTPPLPYTCHSPVRPGLMLSRR